MANDIRGDDTFDSRDAEERIDDLRTDLNLDRLEEIAEEIDNLTPADDDAEAAEIAALEKERAELIAGQDESDAEELAQLEAFKKEAEGYCDWSGGETFIRDDYFERYAQELAEETGMINADARWPNNCIDWEKAARELKQDYTESDLNGVTYQYRCS